MKKIYQTIIDKDNGNCMQATIASLFNKELNDVPNFIEYGQLCYDKMEEYINSLCYTISGMLWNKNYNRLVDPTYACFRKEKWYTPSMLTYKNLKQYDGVNGYFMASVLSPKYFNFGSGFNNSHCVICDSKCNIVHDPNPENINIIKYPLSSLLNYGGIINITLIKKNENCE